MMELVGMYENGQWADIQAVIEKVDRGALPEGSGMWWNRAKAFMSAYKTRHWATCDNLVQNTRMSSTSPCGGTRISTAEMASSGDEGSVAPSKCCC